MNPQNNLPLPLDDKITSMELPQIHADTIGRLVLEKFMEVIKGQETYSRRKVLAGIVMTENMNFNEAKVSCLHSPFNTPPPQLPIGELRESDNFSFEYHHYLYIVYKSKE